MKKILSIILCLVCFLGSAYAQNPTLVRSTNITSGIVIGGPMGNVYINSGFSNANISISERILRGGWLNNGTFTSTNGNVIIGSVGSASTLTINVATTVTNNFSVTNGVINSTALATTNMQFFTTNGLPSGRVRSTASGIIIGGDNPGFGQNSTITLGGGSLCSIATGTIQLFGSTGTTLSQFGNQNITYLGITNVHNNGMVWNGPTATINPIMTFSSNTTFLAGATNSQGASFVRMIDGETTTNSYGMIEWTILATTTTGVTTVNPTNSAGAPIFSTIRAYNAMPFRSTSSAVQSPMTSLKSIGVNNTNIQFNTVNGRNIAALGDTVEFAPDGTTNFIHLIGR